MREFSWDDQLVEKQKQELEDAGTSEKELWVSLCALLSYTNYRDELLTRRYFSSFDLAPLSQTELLRLSRTSFSEAYQGLTHLKVVRTFVESVLRFGLPADYFGITIKVSRGHELF